ncbi:lipid-binding SYLF domain-containing protein [Aminomonas paucivorans]|nr:twin-arginine translocation pathway signal protein [Aminomonas paucivorans]
MRTAWRNAVLFALVLCGVWTGTAFAFSAARVEQDAREALRGLYETTPEAGDLAKEAKGILVFPQVVKAGFVVGAQHGIGVLFQQDAVTGYYETDAASYGIQAGVQKFGYALFLLSDSAMENLRTSDGWEVGSCPSLVIVDKGWARSHTTTTARKDVYAFFFGQHGLMLGMGFQGSKVTRVTPDS